MLRGVVIIIKGECSSYVQQSESLLLVLGVLLLVASALLVLLDCGEVGIVVEGSGDLLAERVRRSSSAAASLRITTLSAGGGGGGGG